MNSNERMAEVAVKLMETSFYKMPASAKHHNNFTGGLFDHCSKMWLNLEKLTASMGLTWQDRSSPFIIAMLHDACKIDAYFYNHDYGCWEYSDNHPTGHGDLSLRVAEQLGIELTEEEKACIRWHMGAFEVENQSGFTKAVQEYPNVLWTHTADMMSSQLQETTWVDPNEDKRKVCCLCGEPLQDGEYGNNPAPLRDEGVCCDECNYHRVIPARLAGGKTDEE